MSLFGTPATSGGLSFGAPAASAAPSLFGSAAAPLTLGGAAAPTTTAVGGSLFASAAPVAPVSVGLGGLSGPLGTTASAQTGAKEGATQVPLDTDVPDELRALLGELESKIRENKMASDEMSLHSMAGLNDIATEIQANSIGINAVGCQVASIKCRAEALKEWGREEVRGGELAVRRGESLPSAVDASQLAMAAVARRVAALEPELAGQTAGVQQLERLLSAAAAAPSDAAGTPTFADVAAHLRRMEDMYAGVSRAVSSAADATKEVRKLGMRYRKALYGEGSGDPFGARRDDRQSARKLPGAPMVEPGPNPFQAQLRSQQTQLTAAGKPLGGVAAPKPAPFSFSTATTAPAASLFKPFAPATSAAPAFSSGFGANKFGSSSFNSPASGTLFSTATKSGPR